MREGFIVSFMYTMCNGAVEEEVLCAVGGLEFWDCFGVLRLLEEREG